MLARSGSPGVVSEVTVLLLKRAEKYYSPETSEALAKEGSLRNHFPKGKVSLSLFSNLVSMTWRLQEMLRDIQSYYAW